MKAFLLSFTLFVALTAWAPRLYATPIRILVAAGSSSGLPNDRPLAHPNDDAASVRDVLTSLGGVKPDTTIFLPETTKDALLSALGRAEAMARQHPPDEVTIIVYFSGHGDRNALHIRGESLPTADLSARLASIPASLRIAVVAEAYGLPDHVVRIVLPKREIRRAETRWNTRCCRRFRLAWGDYPCPWIERLSVVSRGRISPEGQHDRAPLEHRSCW